MIENLELGQSGSKGEQVLFAVLFAGFVALFAIIYAFFHISMSFPPFSRKKIGNICNRFASFLLFFAYFYVPLGVLFLLIASSPAISLALLFAFFSRLLGLSAYLDFFLSIYTLFVVCYVPSCISRPLSHFFPQFLTSFRKFHTFTVCFRMFLGIFLTFRTFYALFTLHFALFVFQYDTPRIDF